MSLFSQATQRTSSTALLLRSPLLKSTAMSFCATSEYGTSYVSVMLCYIYCIYYWTGSYKVKNRFIQDTDYYLTLKTFFFHLSVH